jgi:hypothetical protein
MYANLYTTLASGDLATDFSPHLPPNLQLQLNLPIN